MSNQFKTVRHGVIEIDRSYIDFAGDLQSGVLLNQMALWSSRATNSDGWFHKTYADWYSEIYLPEKTIRRISSEFEKRGFLESKVVRTAQNLNSRHYRIDWQVLASQMTDHFAAEPEGTEGTDIWRSDQC